MSATLAEFSSPAVQQASETAFGRVRNAIGALDQDNGIAALRKTFELFSALLDSCQEESIGIDLILEARRDLPNTVFQALSQFGSDIEKMSRPDAKLAIQLAKTATGLLPQVWRIDYPVGLEDASSPDGEFR